MTIKPYQSVFWFCVASAALGLCFVPFLTIGTQGNESKASSVTNFADEEKKKEVVTEPENVALKDADIGENAE